MGIESIGVPRQLSPVARSISQYSAIESIGSIEAPPSLLRELSVRVPLEEDLLIAFSTLVVIKTTRKLADGWRGWRRGRGGSMDSMDSMGLQREIDPPARPNS